MERQDSLISTAESTGDDLVLVDEQDRPLGTCEKLAGHRGQGQLHARSRSSSSTRPGGCCCSGPTRSTTSAASGPTPAAATPRRSRRGGRRPRALLEEFGFDVPLTRLFSFVYRAEDPISGLVEHEYDHVFLGRFDGQPLPNPAEIGAWKWVDPADLLRDVEANSARYTPWFKIALDRVIAHLNQVNREGREGREEG